MLSATPSFAVGSSLLEGSFALAACLHHGELAQAEKDLEHPVAVATLLYEAGLSEEVVAAALLHEVVEETEMTLAEIRARFGPEMADLVSAM